MSALYDGALEANRRLAWAKYYHAREDAKQVAMWAAELAEWLEHTGVDLPEPALQLIDVARAHLNIDDRRAITRFVTWHTTSNRQPLGVAS